MRHHTGALPDPLAKEVAKREALNHDSPSPQCCDQKFMSNANSDDDSLALAFEGVRLRSDTSSTISGAVSHFGSTNGSLATNEGDIYGVSLEIKPRVHNHHRTRHQHSQSFSAAVPFITQSDLKGPAPARRSGSISIPPTIQSASGCSENQDESMLSHRASRLSQAAALLSSTAGVDQKVKLSDNSHNVNTLMLQHGIWSTTPSDLVSYAAPSKNAFGCAEAENFSRAERSRRHTSNSSVSSQQRGLTVLSEDEEDAISKGASIKS